jgi:uncharacterized protein
MERSRFNTIVEVDPSTCLAFNHTRGRLLEITPPIRRYLSGEFGESQASLMKRQVELLRQGGFVVSSRQAEMDYVRHRSYGFRYGRDKVGYSLVFTYECNLRCPYCYEEPQRDGKTALTHLMAVQTVQHIIQEVELSGARELALVLYGGEPLVERGVVEFVVHALEQATAKRGVDFKAFLITNGTLLTEQIVSSLKPGLQMVQLTLEGSREHHDSIRANAAGKGTFDRILKSAAICLAAGVKVQFRIQLTPETWDGAESCMQALEEQGLLRHPNVSAYFFPILDVGGVCSARSYSCFEQYFPPELLRKLWDVALKYRANLFRLPSPVWEQHFCSYVNQHAWIVDPLGRKYKCVSGIGRDDFVAGTVTEAPDTEARTRHVARELDLVGRVGCEIAECRECEALPSCDGGCAYRALETRGSLQLPSCEMHKQALPEQIAYYYRYLRAVGTADKVPRL